MTTRNVNIDWNVKDANGAPREHVLGITAADVVVGAFVVPPDDDKFTLGVVHEAGSGVIYHAVLRDASGKIIAEQTSSQPNFRMFSKRPQARGQVTELVGGTICTLTVEGLHKSAEKADFFFSVGA